MQIVSVSIADTFIRILIILGTNLDRFQIGGIIHPAAQLPTQLSLRVVMHI